MAASAYQEYSAAAAGNFDAAHLDFLLLDAEGMRVAIAPVDDRFLVACIASPGGSVAALKRTALGAAASLKGPLAQVGY